MIDDVLTINIFDSINKDQENGRDPEEDFHSGQIFLNSYFICCLVDTMCVTAQN